MNEIVYPTDEPDKYLWVAFIIDGEVAIKVPFPMLLEPLCAALASDPKLVVLSDDDRIRVLHDWTFDGTVFSPPTS